MKLPGLKGWRERRGMNQQELALAAGLAQQSVSMVERGTKRCSEATAQRLADALGVELADLLRAQEEGRSPPRVSHPSLHRAYLKRILAREVGSPTRRCRKKSWRVVAEGFRGREFWRSSPRGGGR